MSYLINVCGANRSGTTMLDLMLGNSDNAFSCGEIYAYYRPWRVHHLQPKCSCGKESCDIWSGKLKDIPEQNIHREIINRMNVDYVIDSSKEINWLVDNQAWALKNDLHVVNIVVWKKPVSLAYSEWKRGANYKDWKHSFTSYYRKIFDSNLPHLCVSYETLVSKPDITLRMICDVIGMKYFEGKEKFWQKKHHHLFGSAGTKTQVQDNVSHIRKDEVYPKEFVKYIQDIEEEATRDKVVKDVLLKLNTADVSDISSHGICSDPVIIYAPYPAWYYLNKLRQVYRRINPDKRDFKL